MHISWTFSLAMPVRRLCQVIGMSWHPQVPGRLAGFIPLKMPPRVRRGIGGYRPGIGGRLRRSLGRCRPITRNDAPTPTKNTVVQMTCRHEDAMATRYRNQEQGELENVSNFQARQFPSDKVGRSDAKVSILNFGDVVHADMKISLDFRPSRRFGHGSCCLPRGRLRVYHLRLPVCRAANLRMDSRSFLNPEFRQLNGSFRSR